LASRGVASVAEEDAEFLNVNAVLARHESRDLTDDPQLTRALVESQQPSITQFHTSISISV
jgi:hypothetical protein